MGVTGLWRLIEPAGKPVPVETLENKVLAVDISIWLHQMVKGYQDAKGAPLPNAHLIGLFQRVCKLLYFRIKPVFVFDGAFPELKKETIGKRQENKLKYNSESERIKRELALLLSKKTAISSLLGKQISPKKSQNAPGQNDDLFKLPALPEKYESESESEDEQNSSGSVIDLHSVNVESENFKNLPIKEKYDLLIELKDTRKMNSWGKLHELPKKSDNFSDFQMQRLLKRRKVQECLQETEKEMGDCGMSLNDLESFLNEEGIDTKFETLPSRRIAANNTTRFVLINDVKQALAEAKKKKDSEIQASTSKIGVEDKSHSEEANQKKDELQDDLERAIKMSLDCSNDADTSACTSKNDDSWTTYVTDTDYSSDSEEEDGYEPPDISSAKAYIMQYSDFTDRAIDKIVSKSIIGNKNKSNKPKLNEILDEINKEKSVILENVDLSSSDDDCNQDSKDVKDKNLETNLEVDELNKSISLKSLDEKADISQASVVYLGNPVEHVVTLDSSVEEIPNRPKNIIEKEPSSEKENKEESDSSDNEFEEVPEVEDTRNKTVVQLTFNVNNVAPEEDIFADVFVNKKVQSDEDKIQNEKISMITSKPESFEFAEDDDELQKAIKMSLECVAEENDAAIQNNEYINHQEPVTKEKITNMLNEPNNYSSINATSKTSKSQESLIAIQSAQASKTVTRVISVDNVADKSFEEINNQTKQKKLKENLNDTFEEVQTRNTNKQSKEPISIERLNDMVDEIQNEEQDLIQEKGRLDRVGRNITEQMTKEAQELLRLFGIPYIVAPMEAEAQCAFLENVKLTDGTITDDSDIWLFGGKTVYKNFFNQKKHVLQFVAERIEKSFNLNREQLVLLALLVGSDYTTGLTGVGPVTALEILASFPFNKKKLLNETSMQSRYTEIVTGLQEFKKWVRSGKRTDNTSLKKKLRNVAVTDDFPSVRVVQAYLEPNIEKSEEKFSWGEIDITILRDYTKAKFGWSQNKLDEIMKPVMKRIVEKKTQKTVHDYFKRNVDLDSLEDQMSKRVKAAIQRIGSELPTVEQIAADGKTLKPGTKRKVNKSKSDGAKTGPSKTKQRKTDEEVLKSHSVKVVSETKESQSGIEIMIPKTDRFQEIIPQREKDKQSLLQNKMKAIELFRKTQIDTKKKKLKENLFNLNQRPSYLKAAIATEYIITIR